MIGKTLSHYKVLEKIGQGGMGEVYRAEDTNLSRDVAIKVLPEQFTKDPQRLARFEREAKLLASLNHPNIAAIHSFEHADDVHFLVLELVPGETLQERVAKGPLPVEEALEVCRQIAEGVEAAHEKGVIHRDLKPANVKVTPEGKVKILDFGLAKAFEDEAPVTDISQSPTLTEEMTRAGVILGTAAYMSPEQAKGEAVDKRADIFAFGCVLYELLAGKRTFDGKTITETLGAIIHKEPDWDGLPATTPWRIQELLRRCLTKDAHDRLRDIATVRIEVKLALYEPATESPTVMVSTVQPPLWRKAIPWSITTVVIVLAGVGFWTMTRPTPEPLSKFVITPPTNAPVRTGIGVGNELAISPDGRRIVYLATPPGVVQLYGRSLDEFSATPIAGTEYASPGPFFSPDGGSLAFFAEGQLKKVSLIGGAPITICEAPSPGAAGSWAEDTIFFSSRGSLYRVSAAGGEPETLLALDTEKGVIAYRDPKILPGGKALLYTIWTDTGSQIALLSLETGEQEVLLAGRQAHYAPTGHLVYALSGIGTLMAATFDLARLEVTGDSIPLLQEVRHGSPGQVDYSFSSNGTLVYVPDTGDTSAKRTLVWVNRQGLATPLIEDRQAYRRPRLSPDGQRVAVAVQSAANQDIWIYDIGPGTRMRLTVEGNNFSPVWTPDGNRVTFAADRDGTRHLYWKPADGSGQAEPLLSMNSENRPIPTSWSPDGESLAFYDSSGARDIWVLPREGDASTFVATAFDERSPMFSPDGRWLAYVSDESGRDEIYVQPYPGPGGKWPISTEGGTEPRWSADGHELFYRLGDKLMIVEVQSEPAFTSGRPQLVFEGPYLTDDPFATPNYDISPDGQRFLMIKQELAEQAQIHVVLNWFEELKRLVPTP